MENPIYRLLIHFIILCQRSIISSLYSQNWTLRLSSIASWFLLTQQISNYVLTTITLSNAQLCQLFPNRACKRINTLRSQSLVVLLVSYPDFETMPCKNRNLTNSKITNTVAMNSSVLIYNLNLNPLRWIAWTCFSDSGG